MRSPWLLGFYARSKSQRRQLPAIGLAEGKHPAANILRFLRMFSVLSNGHWLSAGLIASNAPARIRHPYPDVRFSVMTQGGSPVR